MHLNCNTKLKKLNSKTPTSEHKNWNGNNATPLLKVHLTQGSNMETNTVNSGSIQGSQREF